MAAPLVAGALGLYLERFPMATPVGLSAVLSRVQRVYDAYIVGCYVTRDAWTMAPC
jgi:hypothetical protein